eukprot:1008610-Prymnesium_polylepis.1
MNCVAVRGRSSAVMERAWPGLLGRHVTCTCACDTDITDHYSGLRWRECAGTVDIAAPKTIV